MLADEFTDMDDAEKDKELGNAFKESPVPCGAYCPVQKVPNSE